MRCDPRDTSPTQIRMPARRILARGPMCGAAGMICPTRNTDSARRPDGGKIASLAARAGLQLMVLAAAWLAWAGPGSGQTAGGSGPRAAVAAFDLALLVSVDVSESVDDRRYVLQMDGIAQALEDPNVISTITTGQSGAILFAMVAWGDRSEVAIPWVEIRTPADARRVAARVRGLKRYSGEFTCLGRMLRYVAEHLIDDVLAKARRIVVDVSGDGIDNCGPDETTTARRDELIALGATINGLPIIEDPERIVGSGAYRAPGSPMQYLRPLETRERLTLEEWYRAHVMGGDNAFILPANGYEDFARAMRQKFVTEISAPSDSHPLNRGTSEPERRLAQQSGPLTRQPARSGGPAEWGALARQARAIGAGVQADESDQAD